MKSKKTEFWGLALILASSFLQLFLLLPSQSVTTDAVIYKIETKLDLIFAASRSNTRALYPKESITIDNPEQLKNYLFAEQNDHLNSTKSDTTLAQYGVALCFFAGSGLILLGKHQEIKELESPKAA